MAKRFELEGLLRSTGEWTHLHGGVWDDEAKRLPKLLGDPQSGFTVIEREDAATSIRRDDFATFQIKVYGR